MDNILNIVVPCYNEQECLPDSAEKLKGVIDALVSKGKISEESRIVFVDDGSKDATWDIITRLNSENNLFQGVKLSRNKGHQTALIAGVTYACEQASMVVTIDADLQDDINVIEEMVDKYLEGYEVVYGVRTCRSTDTAFKRGTANLYYKLLSSMGVEIVDNHADFRLMSKRACLAMLEYHETNLFLRGIVPQIGFKSCNVGYERKERTAGVSKYPLSKMLSLAFDGITSFSLKPLKLITSLGGLITFLSLAVTVVFSILFICGVMPASMGFYILMSVWLVGGINLLMLGILGEYVGRIYRESKHRPRFFIEETLK